MPIGKSTRGSGDSWKEPSNRFRPYDMNWRVKYRLLHRENSKSKRENLLPLNKQVNGRQH
jgi:hypothetical protein